MSCCCNNTKELGCFVSCEDFDTELVLPAGDYTLAIEFNGRHAHRAVTMDGIASLKISRDWVNEDYDHKIMILKDDGTAYTWTEGPETYDCVLVQVKPQIITS